MNLPHFPALDLFSAGINALNGVAGDRRVAGDFCP
jgi:hypothetical protein